MSMLSLPFELQEQILNYLGHQDLLSLAQTCRSLNFVASARLRAIIPKLNFSTFTRCIHVLIANPVRAAEILELNIANYEFNAESLEPRPPPSRGSSFITSLKAAMLRSHPPAVSSIEHRTLPCNPPPLGPHHLSQAFTNMTRLRKLVIHTPQSPILWMAPVVVGTLREIYAHDRAESSPMLGWISYQPHINTLRIHCNGNKLRKYRVSPPNSIFFPSLSLLTTNPGGASILLPESVVEDLHIENLGYHNGLLERLEGVERPQDPSLIQAIRESHERTPLRRLTLTGNASDIFKFLNSLAEGGVALPHIRIAPCCGIAQSFQTLWGSQAEDTMPLLSGLEIIEIFNGGLDQQHSVAIDESLDQYRSMEWNKALMWGRKCPSLHTIQFPSSRWCIEREGGELSVTREW